MSSTRGLVYIDSKEEVTNFDRFHPYIKKLYQKMGYQPFALFMDQLTVHKMKRMHELYDKQRTLPIFNVTASPDFNCIEAVFSQVKNVFRRRRLTHLANSRQFDLDNEVALAF